VKVIKNSKNLSKTEKILFPEEHWTRAVSGSGGAASNPLREQIFFGFQGLFQIFNHFYRILRFFTYNTPFSSKFFDDLWKFSLKKLDLSRGPFYTRKIGNTEGTEAPVPIINLFDLSSFDSSRVDCTYLGNWIFGKLNIQEIEYSGNLIFGKLNNREIEVWETVVREIEIPEIECGISIAYPNDDRQFRSSNFRHIQSNATRRCVFLCVCACVDYLHVDQ